MQQLQSPLSNCNVCMEVCPTSGIKLNRAGLEVLICIECGLCSSVCPTESLLWKAPSPLQTIDRVEHINWCLWGGIYTLFYGLIA